MDELLEPKSLFCVRGNAGEIIGITQDALSAEQVLAGQWQAVSSDDEQVRRFVADHTDHANLLNQTDVGLARVLEDLIDVLINRGLIQFTDLPQAAQVKLLERRQSRASMSHRLQLMPLDGENDLL